MQSVSINLNCNRDVVESYWSKVIRKGTELPRPDEIRGGRHVPVDFHPNGDEELFEGDFVIEAYAEVVEGKFQTYRERSYKLSWMNQEGKLVYVYPDNEVKQSLKAQGLPPSLLPGAGQLAACIRVIHALRQGLKIYVAKEAQT